MTKRNPIEITQQAVFDLIGRDAEPLIERFAEDYVATHKREPTDRDLDKAAQRIIDDPDGKTWSLRHVQDRN
jgi:hypothetical protein